MLWLLLAARNSHRWGTGAVDRYFAFICARCGVTTSAMVRSFGFGTGSSLWAAQQSAAMNADQSAYRSTSACACPSCGELQPQIVDQFARAAAKSQTRAKIRIPLAIALAFVTFLLLAIPAVADLKHSTALTAVALSSAGAVGALVLAILTGRVITPGTDPAGVWFSRDPAVGPHSWFPAQPGRAPYVSQPAQIYRALSFITLSVTAISALVALIVWSTTFKKVYVVSSEGSRGDLIVKIDGENVGSVKQNQLTTDAPMTDFEVRTDSTHQVVVKGADGRELSYELDPDVASSGWILAPQGRKHGMCLVSLKWYYGRPPPTEADPEDKLFGKDSDLVVLPHSFDYLLVPPPSTIQTKNGASETRTSLRALDCASLADEKIVPYKTAPGH